MPGIMLNACRVASQPDTLEPAPTVEIKFQPDLPAPVLFDTAWADRSIYAPGLIAAQRSILDQLPGASVYHIEITLNDDLTSLEGLEEVRYANRSSTPLDAIYFRLFPNLFGGVYTTVDRVSVNERTVVPSHELNQSAMRVPLHEPLQPGEQVVIQIIFSVTFPSIYDTPYGFMGRGEHMLALAYFYPMIAVFDDEGWNIETPPEWGEVIYSETSFYQVRVIAPLGQT
ncbi:MAG TPA: hypothetical protein VID27_02340, partial [Blastocatellia bacterium]